MTVHPFARLAHGRRVAAGVITVALIPFLAPDAQGALLIHGTVQDEQGRPIADAKVEVQDDAARAESDLRGAFVLRLTRTPQDTYRVSVRRIGFTPMLLTVSADGAIDVRLRRTAAPLEAVVVHGRRAVREPMAGFYERRALGHGRFFTADDVERRGMRRMSDLLRSVPGLRIRQRNIGQSDVRLRGATVAPLVWLDGVPMSTVDVELDRFDPRTFAGIEIYSGSATVPLQFAGGRAMSTSGGTIVLWSRQGEASPRTRKKASPAALVARLLERGEAYTADHVSVPARPLRPMLILPLYPDSLYDAHVAGHVEVEFVVDETGQARMDTFGVVSSSHPALVEAVRRALGAGRQEFVPATLDGRAVAQLVQLPFEFRLDDRP
ncbi:MAG TPA: TonB-dependent receptor plug domain-containing protein [Gemmatimonadaceae bacterium]|nr:TonB-dependent receptor plug domain-containing protein [Gemmatimonadaceae bacterium]